MQKTKKQGFFKKTFSILFILTFILGFSTQINSFAADVSGMVYQDYNNNGVYDTNSTAPNQGFGDYNLAVDDPISGVTVTAYDVGGNIIGSPVISDSAGQYTLTNINGPARIEFTGYQSLGFESSVIGSNSNTSIQFVDGSGGNISGIDFAVNRPQDYCENNPVVITNCYVGGHLTEGDYADLPSIVGFDYSGGSDRENVSSDAEAYEFDQPTAHSIDIRTDDIGATWGLTNKLNSDGTHQIYAAAFLKRGADFGVDGPGAIYTFSYDGTNPGPVSTLANLTAGLNPHPDTQDPDGLTGECNPVDPGLANYIPAGGNDCWFHDPYSYFTIGKMSLGDIDISEDGGSLFVMNLLDKNLYVLDSNTGSTTANIEVPGISAPLAGVTQSCASSDIRPMAVSYNNVDGLVYVGLTCSAESTQVAADLQAYVYTFDPASNSFSAAPVLEYDLSFPRTTGGTGGATSATWNPWTTSYVATTRVYAQPLVSDIVFDKDQNMIIGIKDIFGDQGVTFSYGSIDPTSTSIVEGITYAEGDIMRACYDNGLNWDIEGVNGCPQNQSFGDGINPFYSEFFNGDGFANAHTEASEGGIDLIPGGVDVLTTQMDPAGPVAPSWNPGGATDTAQDQGVRWMSLVDGTYQKAYRVLDDEQAPQDFGKANGLGDLEILCSAAPIEVGNRIWHDIDMDGIQDPGEAAISGVIVELYDSSNNLVGSAVTDANGNYAFSSNPYGSSTSSLVYNLPLAYNSTGWEIRVDTTQSVLNGLELTQLNSDGTGNGDSRDSDASISSFNAVVNFGIGEAGQSSHAFDIGFADIQEDEPAGTGLIRTGGKSVNISLVIITFVSITPIRFFLRN